MADTSKHFGYKFQYIMQVELSFSKNLIKISSNASTDKFYRLRCHLFSVNDTKSVKISSANDSVYKPSVFKIRYTSICFFFYSFRWFSL